MSTFFQGTVQEAIAAARTGGGQPLIVLLTGFDAASRAVQEALLEQAGEEHCAGSVVLALEDDLGNSNPADFAAAKSFRVFCPTQALPTVVMVGPNGAILARVCGEGEGGELRLQLANAFALWKQAQQLAQPAQATAAIGAAGAAAEQVPAGTGEQARQDAAGAGAAEGASGDGSGSDDDAPPALESVPDEEGPPELEDEEEGMGQAAGGAAQEESEEEDEAAALEREVPLRLRFSDGASLDAVFRGASLLAEVFQAVDSARAPVQAGERPTAAPPPLLPYVLAVVGGPRRLLGAAQEGLSLFALGVQPRSVLSVVTHPTLGHQPPQQQHLEQQQEGQGPSTGGVEGEGALGLEAEAAAQEAARAVLVPQQVDLQVRLTNADTLMRRFDPGTSLAEVLDWVDANRSDRGRYRLTLVHPRRALWSSDFGSTLQELGMEGRSSLLLEPLAAPKPAPKPRQKPTPAEPPPLPALFVLQVKLPGGEFLRADFPPESTLQQVAHHIDTYRADGGQPYMLSLPYPKRRFGAEDMGSSLLQLGLASRQTLLVEPTGPPPKAHGSGRGRGLLGLLGSAASFINPLRFLGGGAQQAQQAQQQPASQTQQAQQVPQPAQQQEEQHDAATQASTTRKRALGGSGGGGGNVHTLASTRVDEEGEGGSEGQDPGRNAFWNGNSTQFGSGPPPPDGEGEEDGSGDGTKEQ